jgi:cytoskeleton protein RodZ
MPAFGENLRREREMRGVSLEEISGATKISIRFLSAIENEEFSTLPGGIFARSFVRTYARYLGLDEERVMAEYQLAAQPTVDLDLHRLVANKSASSRSGARGPLIALLVAVVMLSGGYLLYKYSHRIPYLPGSAAPSATVTVAPSQAPPAPAPAAAASAEASATESSAATPASPAARPAGGATPSHPSPAESASASTSQPPGEPATKPLYAETGLVLQVAATERSWVAVDADGKTVLQRVLNPNEVKTLKARNSFDITTGNAQGVILTLNGETLKPLGRQGEVKSLHLTREDVKNPAP